MNPTHVLPSCFCKIYFNYHRSTLMFFALSSTFRFSKKKPYMRFSSPPPPYVSYAQTITSPFICLSWCFSVRYTNYEVTYPQITGRKLNRWAAERSIMLAWLLLHVACVVGRLLQLRSPSGWRWYFEGKVRLGSSFLPFLAIGRRRVLATYSTTTGKTHACSFYCNIVR